MLRDAKKYPPQLAAEMNEQPAENAAFWPVPGLGVCGALSESHLESSAFQPPYAGTFMCMYVPRYPSNNGLTHYHFSSTFQIAPLRTLPVRRATTPGVMFSLSLLTHALYRTTQPFPRSAEMANQHTSSCGPWIVMQRLHPEMD